jgi:hypothetical protein
VTSQLFFFFFFLSLSPSPTCASILFSSPGDFALDGYGTRQSGFRFGSGATNKVTSANDTSIGDEESTGIDLGTADVLGLRGSRTATAQVVGDDSLHVSSLFGGTRITHIHVQAYRSYQFPKPSAACAQGT